MTDTLEPYLNKRRFDSTPEPGKTRAPRRKVGDALHFVIQKHAASHLHYDFRLELDGTLKSWAIPKGPSLDPAEKRMAVQVEDHPLSYADFEGTIPPGNYGAGTVIVWDRGEWIPLGDPAQGYATGKLKFELRGAKLTGRWTLVRTRLRSGSKESWLLIKERDDAARPRAELDILAARPESVLGGTFRTAAARAGQTKATQARSKTDSSAKRQPALRAKHSPASSISKERKNTGARTLKLPRAARVMAQPLFLSPQLATLVDHPPNADNWLFEVKFDGYRMLTRIDTGGEIHLFTRNGNDWTTKLPTLRQAMQKLDLSNCWLDGEIIATDVRGMPSFQALQNMFEAGATTMLQYFIFDLPYYAGHDLSAATLRERRDLLRSLIPATARPILQFSEELEAPNHDPRQMLEKACALHLEGLIGKRADSGYHGGRTRDWIKLKCKQRQEFVIVGFTDSKAVGHRSLGALLLAVNDIDGKLRYAGKVGTGFTQQSLLGLHKKLKPLQIDKSPLTDNRAVREVVHWVKPKLVAEVEFGEWTRDGHIRHASFQGLRSDKTPRAITQEVAVPEAMLDRNVIDRKTLEQDVVALPETSRKGASKKTADATKIAASSIQISHPDRIVDAASGTTKGDIVTYYASVSPWLLPQLQDRPLSLMRAPDGVEGELFFQKHNDSLRVPQLRQLDQRLLPGHPPLIAIDSLPALLGCAQMNVIELHTWNARITRIEQPDRMLFDLDPGTGVAWDSIVDAAMLMKTLLDKLHLRSFLKTSGGKGLHIVVPLLPDQDWDTVKNFSAAVARHMATTLPQLFVAKSGPKNRINRIFIDYLRNGRAATTVAAFSLRARPGLGVSMPLAWDTLPTIDGAAHWHIGNVDGDVAAQQMKSWQQYPRIRQKLTRAMRVLDYKTTS